MYDSTTGRKEEKRREKKRKEEKRREKKRREEKRRLSGWLGGAVGPTRKIGAFYLDTFRRKQVCYAIYDGVRLSRIVLICLSSEGTSYLKYVIYIMYEYYVCILCIPQGEG